MRSAAVKCKPVALIITTGSQGDLSARRAVLAKIKVRTHRVVAKSSRAETERTGSPRTYAQGMSCLASRSENHRAPDVPSHPASSQPPTTIVSPSAFASARNLSPMWWCGRPKWNRILRSKASASHVRIHIIIGGISEEHPGGIAATQEYNEPRKGLVCVRSVAAKPRRPNPSRNLQEGTDRCWAKRLHHSEAHRMRPSLRPASHRSMSK